MATASFLDEDGEEEEAATTEEDGTRASGFAVEGFAVEGWNDDANPTAGWDVHSLELAMQKRMGVSSGTIRKCVLSPVRLCMRNHLRLP
jgi:hypothetical protein